MIIEGENLETLKVLLSGYRERINCIYIDPPYNTGKDFVYSDKWDESKEDYWEHIGVTEDGIKVDTNAESSGRYHSNWLNMIYSRLLIARQLLASNGVLFISIDDTESANLKKVLDETFGEENFVAQFIWKSRQNKDNRTTTGASIDHEYIYCYSRSNDEKALKGDERKIEQYTNPDNDQRGPWASGNMVGILPETLRPNCHYDLINPKTKINYGRPKMGWRYDKNTMEKLIEEDRVIWPSSPEGRPRRKVFLNELSNNYAGFSSIIGENIYTRNGTQEIEDLFGKRILDFPKPSALISELINQICDGNDIVIDFFAGSGSTGQSILNLNRQNGQIIKFILVQLPELTDEKSEAYKAGYKKISDITIERNKRVIQKLEKEEAKKQPSLLDLNKKPFKTGFKVYKLAKSN
ncbi:MAG: site-specific DNA-methyltransferase, partial [Actinobacteria bacterium]|nr:site-specific DNA-methyltransferase [Actinomycetota bacterium]